LQNAYIHDRKKRRTISPFRGAFRYSFENSIVHEHNLIVHLLYLTDRRDICRTQKTTFSLFIRAISQSSCPEFRGLNHVPSVLFSQN